MNKKISTPIALGIVLILAILVGWFTYLQYSKMQKEWRHPLSEIKISEKKIPTNSQIENKIAKLISFVIFPSCIGDVGWIIYPKGAKAIAMGENLSRVEFWISPTGTGMKDSLYNASEIVKIGNQWEAVLPNLLYVVDLYAVGYDSNGNKVGKIFIGSNIYGSDNTSKYPDNCKK
jgi:hypothetical protein